MPRRPRRHDRSSMPGFIRRGRRGQVYVWDLLADGMVPVDESGRVDTDSPLGLNEIPPDVANEIYDEEDIEDAE